MMQNLYAGAVLLALAACGGESLEVAGSNTHLEDSPRCTFRQSGNLHTVTWKPITTQAQCDAVCAYAPERRSRCTFGGAPASAGGEAASGDGTCTFRQDGNLRTVTWKPITTQAQCDAVCAYAPERRSRCTFGGAPASAGGAASGDGTCTFRQDGNLHTVTWKPITTQAQCDAVCAYAPERRSRCAFDGASTSAAGSGSGGDAAAAPFRAGALVAGGRVYMVVSRPDNADRLLAASDVAGVLRSSNAGDRFMPANDGFDVAADLRVGAVHWSTRAADSAATAYACTSSGIYRSVNNGRRWTALAGSSAYKCNGNGHFEPRPRQAGRLLLTSGAYLFVGSATAGVARYDGTSWTELGLSGARIQGIALVGTTLYVAVGNSGAANGVHAVANATGSAKAPSPMTQANAPGEAWDLVAFNGELWVGATGGIHRFDGSSWSRWRPAGTAGDHWSAVAGGYEGNTPTIYAALQGGAASKTNASMGGGVWRTSAGAVAWTDLTAKGTKLIDCQSSKPLWTDNFNVIGYPNWRPAHLEASHGVLRANFWRRDGGKWCPTVDGMLVTGATNIAVDPDSPADLYVSTADYGIIHSSSHGVALPGETGLEKLKHELAGAAGNADRSLAVAFDRSAGDVIATTGNRNIGANNDADIIVFPKASFGSRKSIKGNLPDKRAWAVGVNRVASCGAGRIIVAALEGGGIWRNVGDGSSSAWTKVAGGAAMSTVYGDFPHVTIQWSWGSPTVFLYDPDSGAWRSKDCGASWSRISARTATHPYAGFAAHRAADDTLFVAVTQSSGSKNGIFPIANASTCVASSGNCPRGAALPGAPARPGAIAVDLDGDLWAVGLSGAGHDASLSYRTADGAWVDRSDNVSTGAALALRIAFGKTRSSGQFVYLSFKTNAFIRGRK